MVFKGKSGNGGDAFLQDMMKCPGCGAQFDSKEKLIDHVVNKHGANCQICGAKTTTREELIAHNREKHGI